MRLTTERDNMRVQVESFELDKANHHDNLNAALASQSFSPRGRAGKLTEGS